LSCPDRSRTPHIFRSHGKLFLYIFLCLSPLRSANRQSPADAQSRKFPFPEKLSYNVEWRLMNAGTAEIDLGRDGGQNRWNFNVNIQSAGLVSRLYRVADVYHVKTLDRFCLDSATLDAQEGKKHSISRLAVNNARSKVVYEERNVIQNHSETKELDIAACSYEILGALATLRTLNLEPGKSTTLPITDGKKFAQARISAELRETISVDGKKYSTTRYEAFLFDNVVYKRRGRLLVWIDDSPGRLPVQLRLLLGFPIGTITVELRKQKE
jgi:hypothetical protein